MIKIALITGGTRGIGFETAKKIGSLGYKVILAAQNQNSGYKAVQELRQQGIEALYVSMDVSNRKSVTRAFKFIEKNFPHINLLINNAGIFIDTHKRVTEISTREFLKTLSVNLIGPFLVTNTFLPLLKKVDSAKIINVSSDLASLNQASDPSTEYYEVLGPAYRTSKAALNMLSISFAKDLSNANISVNVVNPGWCRTELGTEHAPNSAADGANSILATVICNDKTKTGKFFYKTQEIAW